MKKYLLLILVVLTGILSSCKYDDDELWGSVEDLANRVSAIEALTKQKNSDIAAMQSILNALENEIAVSDVENLTDGYILHFTDGTSVTIKNGKNGSEGANGADGEDGEDGEDGKDAPFIYVKQENGVWYWTITVNGTTTWLTDDQGNKLPVINGPLNAEDGTDGKPGKDGVDGITPLLGIELDDDGFYYWTVSLDGGETYTRIQHEGADLVAQSTIKGDVGNSLFEDVLEDDEMVTIVMADGNVYELLFQKSIVFYALDGTPINPKNTTLNGVFVANYTFELQLENAKFEVVADDGVVVDVCGKGTSGTVDYTNPTVNVTITNKKLAEARAVILFFCGNKTLTAVFKFNMGPWDGMNIKKVEPNAQGIYEIATPAELAWLAYAVNIEGNKFTGETIELVNNLDLNNKIWTPIGTPEHPFEGIFNGNGNIISNLNVANAGGRLAVRSRAEVVSLSQGVGMFGVANNATFENVVIQNAKAETNVESAAAAILVGVATGTTEVKEVTIENGQSTATGNESAAGLLVGKATGEISVINVNIISTPNEDEEVTATNKVEATYVGGVVGHFEGESVSVEGTSVSGLELGVNVTEGNESAGGAVLGKVDAGEEGTSVNVSVSGAEVFGVNVKVDGNVNNENGSSVSVGAVAGAVGDAANANINISDNKISDVKTETQNEETASNINQGTILGNLNDVIENNPQAGAEILNGNEVAEDVEIKNQLKVESLNEMFAHLYWDAETVPQYSFDIDGEISENTQLEIPNTGYSGTLNLNFKHLSTSLNSEFTIFMPDGGSDTGMTVNLTFSPEIIDQHIFVNMPNVTVNLQSGHFENLKAATAVNTLYVNDGVTIKQLEIYQGNVRVAANGRITESLKNHSDKLIQVVLEAGATAEANLPIAENIGENIEIVSDAAESIVIIENAELSTALQGILGTDRVTLNAEGFAVMQKEDVESITVLDFNWRGYRISNLHGIENFKNLGELYLNSVLLKECDLSKNPSIRILDLKWNYDLVSVDFSNNPNLEVIYASYCRNLTKINFAGCEKLDYIELNNTALAELDLTDCVSLSTLNLSNTPITKLNLTGCRNLDTVNLDSTSLTELNLADCTNLHTLNVTNVPLTELNIPNPGALTKLLYGSTSLSLDLTKFVNLIALNIDNNNITSLDFIPDAIKANLQELACSSNNLESLDLTKFPKLINLYCYRNQLKELDVTGTPSLQTLYCFDNQMETLDVSSLNNLKNLGCGPQKTGSLILTLNEAQKKLWTESWKNNGNNNNVVLYGESVDNGNGGGSGFGNGGKF